MAKRYKKVSYRKTIVELHVNRLAHRVLEMAMSNRVPFDKIRSILFAVRKDHLALVEVEDITGRRAARYFMDDELLFYVGEHAYALTNQWTEYQVKHVVEHLADRFPHLHLEWSA